jgi:hypothetical protein
MGNLDMRLWILAATFAVSCAPLMGQASPRPNWCELRYTGRDLQWSPLENAVISPVEIDHLSASLERLRDTGVVEISEQEAQQYSSELRPGTGEYYLIRAGIYAPPGAQADQVRNAARAAAFEPYISDDNLILITMQTLVGERQQYNYAVILRSDRVIRHVYGGCFMMS